MFLDGDLVVPRARFAEEVVLCGEMDQRGDVRPMMLTGGAQSLADTLIGCDRSLANPAVGARDDDDAAVRIHGYGPGKPTRHVRACSHDLLYAHVQDWSNVIMILPSKGCRL